VAETTRGIDEKRGRTVNRNMLLSLSLSLNEIQIMKFKLN